MINVLFIVYEFPPLNSGGSHRPYRFAKHLKNLGINPVIITPEIDNTKRDISLIDDLKDIQIIRTPLCAVPNFDNILSKQYFNILESEGTRWKKYLYQAVHDLIGKYNFEALYVTAPPFSIADLGVQVSKSFHIPLILDMRDSWSNWNITPFASYIHYKLILKKERNWFKHAATVVVTAEQLAEDYTRIHPKIDFNKYKTIRNSYPIKINNVSKKIKTRIPTIDKPLLIGYVGSFYYEPYQRELVFTRWWNKKPYQWFQYTPKKEDWLYRSPYFFFKALRQFRDQNPKLADLIRVEFIGLAPNWLKKMIVAFNLENIILLKGFVPHKESLDFQKRCDILLGTSHKVINGKVYCIGGKTYEYIYMQKPILSFVKEGAQKQIFEESGLGIICDSDELEQNIEILKKLVIEGMILQPSKQMADENYTGYTAKKLASLIYDITETYKEKDV